MLKKEQHPLTIILCLLVFDEADYNRTPMRRLDAVEVDASDIPD